MPKNFYTTGEVAEICNVSPTTIFRAIINNHIKAATTPGGHFRIPREELETFLKKNNVPMPATETATKRVLIVEDNPVERRAIQRVIGSIPDIEIRATSHGYEAGFITHSFVPDVLILDIFLEDLDGRQIIKLLRDDEKFAKTKIIVVSGAKDPADVKEIKALKTDAYLQKPISPDQLRALVKTLI